MTGGATPMNRRAGPSGIVFVNVAKSLPDVDSNAVESTRYTPEDVAKHNRRDDAWVVYKEYVYDVTMYLQYHPGGPETMMPLLGKDITTACQKAHGWVNVERTIEKLRIGRLCHQGTAGAGHTNAFSHRSE